MYKRIFSYATIVCSLGIISALPAAAATTRYVNNGSIAGGSCPGQYQSIQSAINASSPGDTVIVCDGIYNEQVTIAQTLTLSAQSGATIQPANVTPNVNGGAAAAIVYVNTASKVTVSGFIVDGSMANVNNGCATDFYGIYYSNSSGTIVHNAVRNIELGSGLLGCQDGLAIYADNPANAANTVTIEANSVHDFQKNGITAVDIGLVPISRVTILPASDPPRPSPRTASS